MFSKLFGGKKSDSNAKKKDSYYLELDEKESSQSAVPTDQAIVQTVAEKLPEPEPTSEAPSVEETKPEPVKAEAEPEAEAPKKTKKTSLKSRRAAAKTALVEQQKPVSEPTPAAQVTTSSNNNQVQVEPQTAEFATRYLITQTLSRRRPGPSLNPFIAMARQVKTPNR